MKSSIKLFEMPFVRFVVGSSLAALGVRFVMDMQSLTEVIPGQEAFPLAAFVLAHVIVLTHIGGGLLMAAGFLTRWAAIAQIPILVGALTLVPSSASVVISPAFALPLAVMALLIARRGGGVYSVDEWLTRQASYDVPVMPLLAQTLPTWDRPHR